MSFADKVSGLVDRTMKAGGQINDEFNALLDQYGATVKILESYGFRVEKCKVSMGLLPKIQTSICGSVDFLDSNRLEGLPTTTDNKLVASLISGLKTVAKVANVVDLKKLPELRINIILAVPPEISFEFADESRGV